MKNSSIISTLLILLIIGCNPEKTYYAQLIKDKTITERVLELNKTLTEIRKTENNRIIHNILHAPKSVFGLNGTIFSISDTEVQYNSK